MLKLFSFSRRTEDTKMEHEGAKQIVLVVEDDDQIAYLLRFILEREGFEVKLARDDCSA